MVAMNTTGIIDIVFVGTLNYSTGESDNAPVLQTTFNIAVMATCLATIFIISIFGNIFVFLVFYKRPVLVTISNRFIVNLTVCNILETVLLMPFVFTSLVSQHWVFGKFLCQATGFLMNATFAASTLTLVVISVDRYCAVVTPLHYSMRITPARSVVIIVLVWLLAVASCIPPLVGWNHYEFQRDKSVCTVLWVSRVQADRYYNLSLVILCFVMPLVVILWAYGVIFRAARNISERTRKNSCIPHVIEDLPHTPLRSDRRRSSTAPILVQRVHVTNRYIMSLLPRRDEWKTAVTSCIVVSTFIFCWLLYFIVIILESLVDNPSKLRPDIKTVSILLAMLNCAFNPLVYVFRNKAPRVELKTILGLRTKRDPAYNGVQLPDGSRRTSVNTCISRQGSQESDIIIQKLHHVTTVTTMTSVVVTDEYDAETVAPVKT